MEGKKFQRKIENFVCGNCGAKNEGSGYTDHCFKCLWSKHVDFNPGDRQELCHGLMKPLRAEKRGDEYIIFYQCQSCGYKHQVKSASEDDFEEILKLMA